MTTQTGMDPLTALLDRAARRLTGADKPREKPAPRPSSDRSASRRGERRMRRNRPWPLLEKPMSLWDPIPVMRDVRGKPVTISLPYRSLLIGGVPGAGKSNALSMPLAVAANDPETELWLFDFKRVELSPWKRCAERFVGPDMEAAVDALEQLLAVLDKRSEDMERQGIRKVARGQYPLILLVVDELMLFTTGGDKKLCGQFSELLRNAVALGRAYGLIPIVCTQKPEGRVIDTNLRDLFAYQWALRCVTPQASDTILGQGRAAQGFSAATIAPHDEGVGWLAAEDGLPVRGRAFHLSDERVHELARRATDLRQAAPGTDNPATGTLYPAQSAGGDA